MKKIVVVLVSVMLLMPVIKVQAETTSPKLQQLNALIVQVETILTRLKSLRDTEMNKLGVTVEIPQIRKNSFEVNFDKISTLKTVTGAGFTEGQFILLVDISVENTGTSKDIAFSTNDFTLKNAKGIEYSQIKKSSVANQPRFGLASLSSTSSEIKDATLEPGEVTHGYLAFYIAAGAGEQFALQFQGVDRSFSVR